MIFQGQAVVLLFLGVSLCQGLIFNQRKAEYFSKNMKLKMLDISSLISEAVESKSADYVYGAVAAPGWALPLGSLLIIATAALPALLRPGEAALEQQRENEEVTNSQFNKRRGKDL